MPGTGDPTSLRWPRATSAARWARLRGILFTCERLLRMNARMDRARGRRRPIDAAGWEAVYDHLVRRVDEEIDRLTVEQLTWDLQRKQRKDGRR